MKISPVDPLLVLYSSESTIYMYQVIQISALEF